MGVCDHLTLSQPGIKAKYKNGIFYETLHFMANKIKKPHIQPVLYYCYLSISNVLTISTFYIWLPYLLSDIPYWPTTTILVETGHSFTSKYKNSDWLYIFSCQFYIFPINSYNINV